MKNYDEIFTFKNLYLAHLAARKGKRHKKEVINFELSLGDNLWSLKNKLDNKTYSISGYNKFIIKDPKVRTIQALSYSDRVVQHCIVDNYLMPILDTHLIYDNGACRINKGTDFCIKRVRGFLTKYYRHYTNVGYVLQFDIHHYFESIKHDILKDKLKKIIFDVDILKLLYNIIDSYFDFDNSGLPIGNQTSQCFALYYLDCIERLIKEKYQIKYYSRYMDDGIIICEDKNKLKDILRSISYMCNSIGLSLNSTKTRIYTLNHGFCYLGFRFILCKNGKIIMKVPRKKKGRITRDFKSLDVCEMDSRIIYYNEYLSKEITIILNKE